MADRDATGALVRLLGPGAAALLGSALALRPAWPSRPHEAPDLAVYWAAARAWAPRAALPDPDALRQAAAGVELGGGWVYPAWVLLPFEGLAPLPFADAVGWWRGVLVAALAATILGWLWVGQQRPWATAGGLVVAAAVFHRGVGTGLLQGNVELVLAALVAVGAALLRGRPQAGGALLGIAASVKLWPLALVGMAARPSWRRTALAAGVTCGALLALDLALTSTPWAGLHSAWRQLPEDGQRSLAGTLGSWLPLGRAAVPLVAVACLAPVAGLARHPRITQTPAWPALVALAVLLAVPRTLPYAWVLALGPCAVAWAFVPAARLGLVAWAITSSQPPHLASMAVCVGTLVGLAGDRAGFRRGASAAPPSA